MTPVHPLPNADAGVRARLRQLLADLVGAIAGRGEPTEPDLRRVSVRQLGKRYDRLQAAYRNEADMEQKGRISRQQITLTTELRRRRMLASDA